MPQWRGLRFKNQGNLKKLIDKKEYLDITSLTISGEINDKDIRVIECLTNLVSLNMWNTDGNFYYFPTLPKLERLTLPKNCCDNYKEVNGVSVHVSDGIKTCTSLRTVCVPGVIAAKIAGLPKLKKIAIYGEQRGTGLCVPVDTLMLPYSGEDGCHIAEQTYCNFKPRYIINSEDETILNTYEPNRTDYKGVNILPVLENLRVNTPENLDLSDVHVIPRGYFESGTMSTIRFSEQLRYIGSSAFKNCKNIASIVFPGENTKLKIDTYGLFDGCTNLRDIHFCGSVALAGLSCSGNGMTLTFDKQSSISIDGVDGSPFDHFVFNAIPVEFYVDFNDEFTDVVSYVQIPKGSKEQFLSMIYKSTYKGNFHRSAKLRSFETYEKYIFEQGVKLKSYDIKVEKPGTILSYLPMDELENIDSLTVTGFLYETDLNIIDKCGRLSYLDLGKAVVTYSPELLKKYYVEREALGALFGMLGAMADAQYDNYEMGALDYAYTKAFTFLMQDATSVKSGSKNSIIPAGTLCRMNFLNTVILPYRVVQIGSDVLRNCPNLEHVELPLYLESIGERSFYMCKKLNDVKFPQSLNRIGYASFCGCNSIEIVDLSHCQFISHGNSVSWDNVFGDCLRLKELRLPQGIAGMSDIRCDKRINEDNPHILIVYFPETFKKGFQLYEYGNCELHFKTANAPEMYGDVKPGCEAVICCPKGSITSYFNAVGGKLDRINIIEE